MLFFVPSLWNRIRLSPSVYVYVRQRVFILVCNPHPGTRSIADTMSINGGSHGNSDSANTDRRSLPFMRKVYWLAKYFSVFNNIGLIRLGLITAPATFPENIHARISTLLMQSWSNIKSCSATHTHSHSPMYEHRARRCIPAMMLPGRVVDDAFRTRHFIWLTAANKCA